MATQATPPRITCPHCAGTMKAPSLPAGGKCNCPKCGQAFDPAAPQGRPVASQPVAAAPPLHTPPTPTAPASSPPKPAPVRSPQPSPQAVAAAHSFAEARQSTVDLPQPGAAPPPTAPNDDISLVCRLCGTRIYAKRSQIGGLMKCPDCHTPNAITAPKAPAPKPAGPTLEGAEEFELSEVVDRPVYSPLIRTDGDFAELANFKPVPPPGSSAAAYSPAQYPATPLPPAPMAPSQLPVAPPVVAPPVTRQAAAKTLHEVEEDHEDLTLSAAPERVVVPLPVSAVPRKITPEQEAEAARSQNWNDEEWGILTDVSGPDGWKKGPFYLKVVECLLQPEILLRWALYTAVLSGIVFASHLVLQIQSPLVIPVIIPMLAVTLLFWLIPFCACCFGIISDTANGMNKIENLPNWDPTSWFYPAFVLLAALFVAGLPGTLLAGLAPAGIDWVGQLVSIVGLVYLLLPIVLCSMLTAESIFAPVSSTVIGTIKQKTEGWIVFYLASSMVFALGGTALALAFTSAYTILPGYAVMIGSIWIYCRLIGRLMWYCHNDKGRRQSKTPTN